MSDPGGSHGWRAARHVPRRRGGLLGELAERAMPVVDRPLCVVLLPRALEELEDRELERLIAAPGVVAVDPARLSYRAAARLPAAVVDGLAAIQARRMNLPGVPYVVAILDALQYPLARALLARHPDAELWYGGPAHELLSERAAMRFDPSDRAMWDRMEKLGIESGRLGSERPDIV
jgi:hypothetical protein